MPLLHNGKPIDLSTRTPAISKLTRFLDKSERLGTFDSVMLMRQSGVGHSTITKLIQDERYSRYYCRWGGRGEIALGHPRAIIKFRKYLAQYMGVK